MVTLRPAETGDAPFAAEMIYATMGPMADAWFGFGDHRLALEKLAWFFSRPENQLSYTAAEILEVDGRPAAFLLSMTGKELSRVVKPMARQVVQAYGIPAALRVAWRTLPMLFDTEAEEDEYYVSNLAVLKEFRRRGLAEMLMHRAEEKARSVGLEKCSLTVELGNEGARALYLKMGYRVVGVTTNALLRRLLATPGWERMVKNLTPA